MFYILYHFILTVLAHGPVWDKKVNRGKEGKCVSGRGAVSMIDIQCYRGVEAHAAFGLPVNASVYMPWFSCSL